MAVWNDLEPGHEAEFDAWYQTQHVPERLRVPGFLEARRYQAVHGSPRYCAFYLLESAEVLRSPAYLERLANPTRWTQRMMPRFRAMARTPCVVTFDRGAGTGGVMTWIACLAGEPSAPPREMLAQCACDASAATRVQLWELDRQAAGMTNPEQQLRAGDDFVAGWIVCIEGIGEQQVRERGDALASALRAGVREQALLRGPLYRLAWRVSAAEAPAPRSDAQAGIAA